MIRLLFTFVIILIGFVVYKLYRFLEFSLISKKIRALSKIQPCTCINFLNTFLDDQYKLKKSEEDNVKFILDDFKAVEQKWFFNRSKPHSRREAFVSSSLYFNLSFYNHLLCHDGAESFCNKTLQIKINSFEHESKPILKYNGDCLGYSTKIIETYKLTEFGITFYKMLVAISKCCHGKKSIYHYPESRNYIYCFYNTSALEKIDQQEFTVSFYRST